MVSPNVQSDVGMHAMGHDRGVIPEETVVAAGPGNVGVKTYYRPFWRPVLAGTLFVLSTFILSWYLMLGFTVGVNTQGMIALGGGAAVWIWVTSCVAYFFGGMIASGMTGINGTMRSGWLKGAVLWGLSLPLALVLYAFVSQSAVLESLNPPHAGMIAGTAGTMAGTASHPLFAWAAFIVLGCGLIFSLIGSVSTCACRRPEQGGSSN